MPSWFLANAIFPITFSLWGIEARSTLDILVVAVLLYAVIFLFKKAHSLFLFNGVGILVLIYIAARYFDLYLTSFLFSFFFGFFVIIFVVVFQRELRRLFEWLSAWGHFSYSRRELVPEAAANQVIQAVEQLAKTKTGALIVFPGKEPIDVLTEGGILLGGRVSVPLLLSIFDASSPGHDGAVIIQGDRVRAFGVYLPLALKAEKLKSFGTRHRAALGLAERADAFVIAVSEERGTVSIAEDGVLTTLKKPEELSIRMHEFLRANLLETDLRKKYWHPFVNLREKIIALLLASFLWYVFAVQLGGGTITRNFDVPVEFRALPAGYVIQDVNPIEANLSLSGKTQDFNFLNAERLKVVVNVSEAKEGKQRFTVTNESIVNVPAALSVAKTSPKTIQFNIKKIPQEKAKAGN
ncbi:MAG: DNA integrity scanning protein DisA nucleotide-binding domain protein [Candidatus Giovannonibacteria bacterium]|nr:MAG: DNA integrity scanning protein DisA nucleotide-binding domain protein [Candidatus Giovannonibacteria bacterium]